jgi:uncharacterized SAM-binding protein YcdF (DUF218 family)
LNSRLRRLSIALAATIVVLAALYVARAPILSTAGHWLDVGESPQPTDYCLVLSGDVQSRPFVAAALFRKGYIHGDIWLTHIKSAQPTSGEATPEGAERAILTKLGVPAGRIAVLDGDCESTFDEAEALASKLAGDHSSTVTIVTSNFHTRRSRYIFAKALAANGNPLHFVSVPTDYFDASNWWTSEEGVASYSKEFLKLPFYVVRYGEGWIWIAVVVVITAAAILWRRRAAGKSKPGDRHPSKQVLASPS